MTSVMFLHMKVSMHTGKTFGKDYFTFCNGPMEGIVLNSNSIQHPER